MLSRLYADWMLRWETALTTRDTNRIIRPLEFGFDWLGVDPPANPADSLAALNALNREIIAHSSDFFGYTTPTDFRLESRHPHLFPTNVRPETLAQDAEVKHLASIGEADEAEFLRFTSPLRTPYPENDQVNARWYPAHRSTQRGRPRQAIIVLPQWNADAFSHNALCPFFNTLGVSALRLSKPYHDIRRPAELERSDFAVSSNLGRTVAACRQAVVDIRSCLDWLELQGYTQFGILGTSLGSCYSFIAAAHDPRLEVCCFNHVSREFGDVVWTGQSTRHIRAAVEAAGMSQVDLRNTLACISPAAYMERFATNSPRRQSCVVHALYDLTFLEEFSQEVLADFRRLHVPHVARTLPCGHYVTGEFPYKYLDGFYMGHFVRQAFSALAASKSPAHSLAPQRSAPTPTGGS